MQCIRFFAKHCIFYIKKERIIYMKAAFKSIGIVIYFLAMQIIVSIGIVLFKIISDTDSFDRLYECLEGNGMLSSEYLGLITQMVIPAAMIADIIAVIPIIMISIYKGKIVYKKVKINEVFMLIGLGISLNLITSGIVSIIPQNQDYNDLMSVALTGGFIMTLFASGIIAPIVEELIFRFCICNFFINKTSVDKKVVIVISAFLFGLAHMNIIQSSYAFVLGLILAWIYIKTNNLLVPTIVHLTINMSSVIYEYLPMNIQMYALSIAGAVLVITVYGLVKKRKIVKNNTPALI